MDRPVDQAFAKALPKVELHAHLSGSISKTTLHKIWKRKRAIGECPELEDPLVALKAMPDIFTFFSVFDQYIYKLINDRTSIHEAVHAVLEDFEDDGVVYLELRTTPRAIGAAGMSPAMYVETVLQAMHDRPRRRGRMSIEAHLLLSIDRRMTLDAATEVLGLARTYRQNSPWHKQRAEQGQICPAVLGIDLCGNPMKGDVTTFTDIFNTAKDEGLHTAVHFAEVPASSTLDELRTILSWQPDRLGHVINVPEEIKAVIEKQDIALELCLSCNMIAKMVPGDYADHHFGYWMTKQNAIALSTDDVGVFESSLSNEYLLAAKHFHLSRTDLINLAYRAATATFQSQERLNRTLRMFAASHDGQD